MQVFVDRNLPVFVRGCYGQEHFSKLCATSQEVMGSCRLGCHAVGNGPGTVPKGTSIGFAGVSDPTQVVRFPGWSGCDVGRFQVGDVAGKKEKHKQTNKHTRVHP